MTKGMWYPTKQAWAEARAAECKKQAEELKFRPTSRAHKTKEKYADIRFLNSEARRFSDLAARYAAAGI